MYRTTSNYAKRGHCYYHTNGNTNMITNNEKYISVGNYMFSDKKCNNLTKYSNYDVPIKFENEFNRNKLYTDINNQKYYKKCAFC